MQAFMLTDQGPAIAEIDTPEPQAGQVLVRVRAAALNRADLAMAAGHRHGRAGGRGAVLGLEWAGEVAAVGAGVTDIAIDDRVMCAGAGGYAEYALCDADRTLPIPDPRMTFEQAATLPVALQTMHDALLTHGRLESGQSVLIQGASSGVGLMGLQIAAAGGAGLIIGTSTDAGRRARLSEFGAGLALDSADPDWVRAALKATGGAGVDLVVDMISGALMNQTLQATRILGRIVNVGRLGGTSAPFNFDLHAYRRITYTGVTFRTRSRDEVREITRRLRADLWEPLMAGRLRLPIDRVYPLADAAAALARMAANRHFGKIVLAI